MSYVCSCKYVCDIYIPGQRGTGSLLCLCNLKMYLKPQHFTYTHITQDRVSKWTTLLSILICPTPFPIVSFIGVPCPSASAVDRAMPASTSALQEIRENWTLPPLFTVSRLQVDGYQGFCLDTSIP